MIINKLKQLSSNQFIQNIGWLGVAELVNRIFRLVTTVILARTFSTYDYGMVSIIYTIFDFGNVFTLRFGLAAKIIHADEQELKIVCDTCYWLNLILCSSLFIIQCIAAYPIAHFYNNDKLILPICIVAIAYLIIPFYTIQATLIERDSRLKVTAFSGAMQAISSNIILVALAVAGMGIWAVVWSMVLSYLVWIPISYRNHSWRPPKSFKIEKWREIASYGSKLLGIDLLGRLRMYLDYLIIGGFLGIDQLGLYFFAFNAGLGLSQSVIYSSTVALFPHLCAVRGNLAQLKNHFFNSLKTIALLLIPLVVLQTSLAQFYVPIVFGQKWVTAIPILVLICCSALPIALSRATSQLLQAVDKSHIDLYWNAIFTAIFAASLLLAVRGGILWVAVAVLITQTLAMPIFTIWINHYIFPKKANL